MEKNKLIFSFACVGTVLFILYVFIALCVTNANVREFLPLIVEIFGSLVLASIVFIFSKRVEQDIIDQTHRNKLKRDFKSLSNQMKRMLDRRTSRWNFSNLGPSFYFDNSKINQLYDLLIHDSRRWENLLVDYISVFKPIKSHISRKLVYFLECTDNALVAAEKVDSYHFETRIAPALAAGKDSPYKADRESAENTERYNYLIHRAVFIEIAETEVLFGLAEIPNIRTGLSIIRGSMKEATNALSSDKDLSKFVNKLREFRSNLQKQMVSLTID